MSCLHILEINPLSVVSFAIIFSHSEGCLFTCFCFPFAVQKAFKFNQVPFVCFCFYLFLFLKHVLAVLCGMRDPTSQTRD